MYWRTGSSVELAEPSVNVVASPCPAVRPPTGAQFARMLEFGMYKTISRFATAPCPNASRSSAPPSSAAVPAPTPLMRERREKRISVPSGAPAERRAVDDAADPVGEVAAEHLHLRGEPVMLALIRRRKLAAIRVRQHVLRDASARLGALTELVGELERAVERPVDVGQLELTGGVDGRVVGVGRHVARERVVLLERDADRVHHVMTLPADRIVRARRGLLPFGEAHAGEHHDVDRRGRRWDVHAEEISSHELAADDDGMAA